MNKRKYQTYLFQPFCIITIFYLVMVNTLFGANFNTKIPPSVERSVESQKKKTLMEGKQKTDLSIIFNFIMDASPDRIFNLWTTVSGIKKFFGVDAVIDLKLGGSYEIYFLPRTDPKSYANSTKGAKLLSIEKGKKLAFEWAMPPFASELNTKPLPTWVEVTFQALKNNSNKTHVCLKHYGFKRGDKWNKVYEFFVRNWALILFRLDLLCATDSSK